MSAGEHLLDFAGASRFGTILADPPWRFANRTGKMAPEHRRLSRYATMTVEEIAALPVSKVAADTAHLYLWVPNALLAEGLGVLAAWGFQYKTNIVWHKIRRDGGSDGRGVGFYFRNVTELLLFGVRGRNARTLAPGRRQVNLLATRKREHSRKPDEMFPIIEACSPGPYLELFARAPRAGWWQWGDEHEQTTQSDGEAARLPTFAPGDLHGNTMRIAEVHSHLGGKEFLEVRKPWAWKEILEAAREVRLPRDTAATVSGAAATDPAASVGHVLAGELERRFGWTRRPGIGAAMVKDRVAVELMASPAGTPHAVFAAHLADYALGEIDVGVTLVPARAARSLLMPGVLCYEDQLAMLRSLGRGNPRVPLVLAGVAA